MKKPKLNPYIMGAISMLFMILFYFGLLWLTTKDYLHSFYFFMDKWYLLTPLFIGFAFQMYLFQKLRFIIQENNVKMTVASAGTSGLAMVACCAHHLADLFPVLGFAGIAIAITKYQDWFLATGVLMNLIGIWYMRSRIKKQRVMECKTVTVNN